MNFDVIIFDAIGMPFTGATPEHHGLGGSEWEEVLLAEGLAKAGKSVCCVNRTANRSRINGVEYHPLNSMEFEGFTCNRLVVMRNTPIPVDIKAEKVFRWVTDARMQIEDSTPLVCVSEWQSSFYGSEERWVIPNMIPDWVYTLKPNRNTQANTFIYASAAMKGLAPTCQYFDAMRKTKPFKNAKLTVLNPGYDLPGGVNVDGVKFIGAVPFRQVVEQLHSHRSMLMTSTFKETFGIVQVLAEILGLNVFVLQSTGKDALSETCNSPLITDNNEYFNKSLNAYANDPQSFMPIEPHDYRVSTVMPKWLELLA